MSLTQFPLSYYSRFFHANFLRPSYQRYCEDMSINSIRFRVTIRSTCGFHCYTNRKPASIPGRKIFIGLDLKQSSGSMLCGVIIAGPLGYLFKFTGVDFLKKKKDFDRSRGETMGGR